jgi:peptidoglycan/xylan/chitin deacetylase (PgdA/CDA1 family)
VTAVEGGVALTFDDGPFEPFTGEILGILDRYGVRATFFLVGRHCEKHPAAARDIVARGHAVGNHSYSHSPLFALDYSCRDAERGREVIEKVTGVVPRLFRPPYGLLALWQDRRLAGSGMSVVRWTLNSGDWYRRDPRNLARHVVDRAGPGDTILLHDGRASGSGADRVVTVKALPLIIEGLAGKGLRFRGLAGP